MKKLKPGFLPAIAWLIISTILLTLPGSAFPKENWLDKIWFDKWVHIGILGGMVCLFGWGMLKKTNDAAKLKKYFMIIAIAVFAYGIFMEFVQDNFIPNRSFDFGDIIADAVGCLAGWRMIKWFSGRYIKK